MFEKNLKPVNLFRFVFYDGYVLYENGQTPKNALKNANIHNSWWPLITETKKIQLAIIAP